MQQAQYIYHVRRMAFKSNSYVDFSPRYGRLQGSKFFYKWGTVLRCHPVATTAHIAYCRTCRRLDTSPVCGRRRVRLKGATCNIVTSVGSRLTIRRLSIFSRRKVIATRNKLYSKAITVIPFLTKMWYLFFVIDKFYGINTSLNLILKLNSFI